MKFVGRVSAADYLIATLQRNLFWSGGHNPLLGGRVTPPEAIGEGAGGKD